MLNLLCSLVGRSQSPTRRSRKTDDNPSIISADHMWQIIEKLKSFKNRKTTMKNYLSIWRQFNRFLLKLDMKPRLWEDHTMLFAASLIENGIQSSTLKSYISAIKCMLIDDDYNWDNRKILLRTLARSCRYVNNKLQVRLPIQNKLLELIIFEIQRIFKQQPYLESS